MFAIFDTKTNKVVFSDDSKAKVLEVFNKTMPDNKGDVYDGYKIVKIETCVKDTNDELYDEIVDLDRTFYAWFLPRLVCFRKHNIGYGSEDLKAYGGETTKQWHKEIDEIIAKLEGLVNNELPYNEVDSAREKINEWVGKNLGKLWL